MSHNRSSPLDRVVMVAILTNLGLVAWSLVDDTNAELLERLDNAVLLFFACELAFRVAFTRLFFRSFWNVFDACVIVAALLPVAGGGLALLRLARLARSLHLMRHTSHLRIFRFFVGWNNKPRQQLEFTIADGKLVPHCFYCHGNVTAHRLRVNRRGWFYGPCCGDKRKVWYDAFAA